MLVSRLDRASLRPLLRSRARSSADRAPDYESVGRGFKSLRARQIYQGFARFGPSARTPGKW